MEFSQFRQLYKHITLHPVENKIDNNDMLKIKIIKDRVITNSRAIYEQERELSLDECTQTIFNNGYPL